MHLSPTRIPIWIALLLCATGGSVATAAAAAPVAGLTGQVVSVGVDDAGQVTIAALGFSSGAAPQPLRVATVSANGNTKVRVLARDATSAQIAVASDGTRAVVWLDAHGLQCMLASAGQPLRACPALGASRTSSREPRLAVTSDGRVVVTWVAGAGHVAVLDPRSGAVRHTRLGASTQLVPIAAPDGSITVPRWTKGVPSRLVVSSLDPAGRISETVIAHAPVRAPIATAGLAPAFAWQRFVANNAVTFGPIFLDRQAADGWRADPVSAAPSTRGGGPAQPAFAVDSAGRQIVAWTEARLLPGTDGGLRRATVRTRTSGGSEMPLGPAKATGTWEHDPLTTAAPIGGFELLTVRSRAFSPPWEKIPGDLLLRHVSIDGALSAPRRVASKATAAGVASSASTSAIAWTTEKREQVWLDRSTRTR